MFWNVSSTSHECPTQQSYSIRYNSSFYWLLANLQSQLCYSSLCLCSFLATIIPAFVVRTCYDSCDFFQDPTRNHVIFNVYNFHRNQSTRYVYAPTSGPTRRYDGTRNLFSIHGTDYNYLEPLPNRNKSGVFEFQYQLWCGRAIATGLHLSRILAFCRVRTELSKLISLSIDKKGL